MNLRICLSCYPRDCYQFAGDRKGRPYIVLFRDSGMASAIHRGLEQGVGQAAGGA